MLFSGESYVSIVVMRFHAPRRKLLCSYSVWASGIIEVTTMRERCIFISKIDSELKRNIAIIWVANFFIAGSMTMISPFISLYIDTFGNFSASYVQKWSGIVFSITFFAAILFAPIWGRFGDQYGRKKILIISATGLGLSVLLMGFATSVWHLFFLRFFMGFFTGFVAMSQVFIAVQTPRQIAGRVLGTVNTGSVTGTLFGPLLGGVLADLVGFAMTFKLVSIAVFATALIVLLFVREKVHEEVTEEEREEKWSHREVLAFIVKKPLLFYTMILATFVQVAHFGIQPILPLFVAELHGTANIALLSGLAFSVTGFGNLLASRPLGRAGDRNGYIKLMILLLALVGLIYVPMAFATTLTAFIVLRFLLGLALGGVDPNRLAYIRQEVPLHIQGEVLGYNTSLRFLGNMIGPTLGGGIASLFGFSMLFTVIGVGLIASSLIFIVLVLKLEPRELRKTRRSRRPLKAR